VDADRSERDRENLPATAFDPRTVDRIARAVLKATRAPGMSVAVVAGEAVYAQGYGVRERGKPDPGDGGHAVCDGLDYQGFAATTLASWWTRARRAGTIRFASTCPRSACPIRWPMRSHAARSAVSSDRAAAPRHVVGRGALGPSRGAAPRRVCQTCRRIPRKVPVPEHRLQRGGRGGRAGGRGRLVGSVHAGAPARPAGHDAHELRAG
jgi:hypothetical protein